MDHKELKKQQVKLKKAPDPQHVLDAFKRAEEGLKRKLNEGEKKYIRDEERFVQEWCNKYSEITKARIIFGHSAAISGLVRRFETQQPKKEQSKIIKP